MRIESVQIAFQLVKPSRSENALQRLYPGLYQPAQAPELQEDVLVDRDVSADINACEHASEPIDLNFGVFHLRFPVVGLRTPGRDRPFKPSRTDPARCRSPYGAMVLAPVG